MIWRALFIVLLLANVSYCGWALSREAPTPVVAPAVQRGEPLVLLSEQEPATLPEPEAVTGTPLPNCYRLGPLPSQGELQRYFAALEPFIERSQERREASETTDGFWVFLPAVSTREQAIEQARQLADAGVRDYYVVTGGDAENTVSLGMYGERANADFRAQTLIDQGFPAQVEQRTEPTTEFWLDYEARAETTPPWQRLIAGNAGLTHEAIDCF